MLRTNKDVRIENWRNHGAVVVPAGLKVSKVSYGNLGNSILFLEEFDKLFPAQSIEMHDATYYGISLDAADVSDFK